MTTSQLGAHYDMSQLPKPMFLLGRLQGYYPDATNRAIVTTISRISVVCQRPLSAEECQAMAYYKAKQHSIQSFSLPIGVIGGFYRAYSTRQTFAFPFMGPDPLVNATKLGRLGGVQAVIRWHVLRGIVYAVFGGEFGFLLLNPLAAKVCDIGLMRDARMKGVVQILGGLDASEYSKRSNQGETTAQLSCQ